MLAHTVEGVCTDFAGTIDTEPIPQLDLAIGGGYRKELAIRGFNGSRVGPARVRQCRSQDTFWDVPHAHLRITGADEPSAIGSKDERPDRPFMPIDNPLQGSAVQVPQAYFTGTIRGGQSRLITGRADSKR